MARADFPVVVIGASAGGVSALKTLVAELPDDLEAAIFVVLHVPAGSVSRLPEILNYARNLPAAHAVDNERIRPGRIYVAPPDTHLTVDGMFARLSRGPRENRQRPAVDPLFRSAARAFKQRVVGIVLSGALDDGTEGLRLVKELGGVAIVQDPAEAETPDMPRSALEHVSVDSCLPLRAIAQRLVALTKESGMEPPSEPEPISLAQTVAADDPQSPGGEILQDLARAEQRHTPSPFTCPECNGTLWDTGKDGTLMRFECRVGHAFSLRSLLAEQSQALERALWVALRTIEENVAMSRRIQEHANQRGRALLARHYEDRARELENHASTVKSVLMAFAPTNSLESEPVQT